MKLSIVTINRNNAEGLRRTMESVFAQTYRNVEYIVIDGASTDGSVDVIREIESANRSSAQPLTFTWISEPDKGIYQAINKGIKRATGDYVQILNSGDLLAAPDVTERMMNALEGLENEGIRELEGHPAILYGNMLKDYGNGRIERDTCGSALYTPESFLYFYNGTLNHDCAYIRRDLFEKYGLYNEDMKICSDWEWYIRAIALGGEKAVYTDIDVTTFDMNGISESGGKNRELILRERRAYLEKILSPSVLRDYDQFAFPILQYKRLKKYHLWRLVYFMERVLFKLEQWKILK